MTLKIISSIGLFLCALLVYSCNSHVPDSAKNDNQEQIIASEKNAEVKPEAALQYVAVLKGEIQDTLVVFDPASYEERVSVHPSGQDLLDLLRTLEGDSFEEFMIKGGETVDTIISIDKNKSQLNRYLVENSK